MITLFNAEVDLLDTLFTQRRALDNSELDTLRELMRKVKSDQQVRASRGNSHAKV